MKKLGLVLLFGVMILFGGKFYLESRYEKKMDLLVRMASSAATLRYDQIKVGFDGSIALLGFSAQVKSGEGGYSVEEVRLSTSDRTFPLFAGSVFKNREYPDSVQIKVSQFSVDADVFELSNKPQECKNLFSTFIYSEVGFDKSVSDMELSLESDSDSELLLDIRTEDQVSISDVRARLKKSALKGSRGQLDDLPVSEIKISTTIYPEVGQKIVDYCASKLGLTNQEYLSYIGSPEYSVNSFGADLGDDVRAALVKFIQGGSKLTVFSRPSAQLKRLSSIQFFKKRDVVRWLRLSIMLDEKNVVINPFDEPTPDSDEVVADESINDRVKKRRTDSSAQNNTPVERSFQTVSVGQMKQYVGYRVRLNRQGEKSTIKGYLMDVKRGVMFVEINRHGGVMTYNIPIVEVTKASVYK